MYNFIVMITQGAQLIGGNLFDTIRKFKTDVIDNIEVDESESIVKPIDIETSETPASELDSEDQEFIDFIEMFENELTSYFQTEPFDFNVALIHFSQSISKVKFELPKFLSKHKLYNEVYESFGKEVDNILDDSERVNSKIDRSLMQSLTLLSDNKSIDSLKKISDSKQKEVENELSNFDKILFFEALFDPNFDKKRLDENSFAFIQWLKPFLRSCFILDFAVMLNDLKKENKIKLSVPDEIELSNIISKANQDYANQVDDYKASSYGQLFFEKKLILEGIDIYQFSDLNREIDAIFPIINMGMVTAVGNIISFTEFESDWDPYGAPRIKDVHIYESIKEAIHIYLKYKIAPSFTAPTTVAGVMLEYADENKEKRMLDILFEDDSAPYSILFDQDKVIFKKPFEISDIESLHE